MEYATGNSKDEKFLQELEQIVITNLQNEQFGVETLAQLKGISRSHLHRKLKLLKKQSVSRFIREIRLKEAMTLLKQNMGNVSEIAYTVGFSSTSYFNTCFHDYYGYPPGEVKKRMDDSGDTPKAATITVREKRSPMENSSPLVETGGTSETKRSARRRLPLQKSLLYAGALLTVLFVIYYTYRQKTDTGSKAPPSIAILPLDHLSEKPEQEYLTAGIHDALIGELGMIKGLRVISRTSTLRYPDSDLLIQDIAKELGVDVIIEGSVLISGDSLRLQLQLIEAFPEERHLWAQEYYQDIPHVLSLQSSAIADIAKTIQVNLSTAEQKRLSALKKVNPETYQSYLRGMYFLNKSTPEEFQKGLGYLHQAIEKDPADPHAYVGLAEGYAMLGHGPNPANTYWQRGKAAALKAIELDSTLARAYTALATISLYYEGDYEGAERAFLKANGINPNIAVNHFHYAWYHVLFGQMNKALVEQKLAKELDPLTPIFTADLGSLYYWMGMDDEAIVELKEALELDGGFGHAWWMLGNVYLRKGWADQAIAAHIRAVEINPVWNWALANTYVLSGNEDKASSIITEIKDAKTITPRVAFGLVQINVSLGDIDEAFYWLEYGTPDVWIPFIRTWPGFELLREDPRFTTFLQAKNLPAV